MTDEREALEQMVNGAVEFSHDADHIMNAVDDLVAAERLAEHVKTCHEPHLDEGIRDGPRCGDVLDGGTRWHCDRAPIKERS